MLQGGETAWSLQGSSLETCPLGAQAQQGLSRRDDGDALEGLEHEQVAITRDDQGDLSGQSQREHLIVIGIAAYRLRECEGWGQVSLFPSDQGRIKSRVSRQASAELLTRSRRCRRPNALKKALQIPCAQDSNCFRAR